MVIPVGAPFLAQHLMLVEKNRDGGDRHPAGAAGPVRAADRKTLNAPAMATAQSARRIRRARCRRRRLPGAAPPLFAVMLLSSAAMGYEVLLTRLFSIIQWHHFAYMMISVALLGYGAAGTFVALAQRALLPRFDAVFAGGAVLFGITAVAGFALAQRVAFNPLEILWDPRAAAAPARHLRAALRSLLLRRDLRLPHVHPVRRAAAPDLQLRHPRCGSGKPRHAGRALSCCAPTDALKLLGALGIAAAALALVRGGAAAAHRSLPRCSPPRSRAPIVIPADWIRLRPSEYKELAQTLRIDGTRIVAEASSPLGLVTVVESARVPLRHAPGMSLDATMEPPPQLARVHRRRRPLRA